MPTESYGNFGLEQATPGNQPRHVNIAAAFGLFTREIARRTEQANQAAHRQAAPGQ
jgi:hypothetical protein